jgi:copper transport protein
VRRLVLLLFAMFGTAVLFAAPASAHAEFTGSTPRDGARLASAPASVTVRFDDVVAPSFVHVTGPSGARVDTGPVSHPGGNENSVSVALRPHLPDGTYDVAYRIVADDGHPVGGELRFVVGAGPLANAPSTDESDSVVAAALDVSRWISYAGFALLGGGWLLLSIWRPGQREDAARRVIAVGLSAAVVGAVLEFLLQGAYVAGEGLGSVGQGALLSDTLHQNYGTLHAVRVGLLLVLAIVPARLVLFAPLMAGIAYTFSAVGHPRTTDPVWLSIALDMLHLLAIAVWIGGVVMLLFALLPRVQAADLGRIMPVWSRVAFVAVAVIAVTGAYAAWRGIGSWRAVFTTEYGLLVDAKIVGFVGLLAVANLARTVVARRTFSATAVEQLRRCVVIEAVVAAAVLGLAAVLVSQPRGAEALALAVGGVR